MTAASGPYGPIFFCDPGPCEPGPLLTFSREFGLWIPLLFLIATFIAGRKASRTNVVQPALVMGLVAVLVHLRFEDKLTAFMHIISNQPGAVVEFGRYRQELRNAYFAGFMFWSVAPFAVGLLMSAVQRWRRNRFSNPAEPVSDPSPKP